MYIFSIPANDRNLSQGKTCDIHRYMLTFISLLCDKIKKKIPPKYNVGNLAKWQKYRMRKKIKINYSQ